MYQLGLTHVTSNLYHFDWAEVIGMALVWFEGKRNQGKSILAFNLTVYSEFLFTINTKKLPSLEEDETLICRALTPVSTC